MAAQHDKLDVAMSHIYMKNYKDIISEITSATDVIKDQKIRELAFQRLLEDALGREDSEERQNVFKKPNQGPQNLESPTHIPTPEKQRSVSKNNPAGPYRIKAVSPQVKNAFSKFDPNQFNLKPFKQIKQKIEKYLWILEYGRKSGIETMTNNEVAYVLGEKLLESVTEKQVNNLKQKVRDGYITKWDTGWKILQKGIDKVNSPNSIKTT